MAFMNKERKAERMPAIKAVLKKYGMKGSVAVRHYSTLVVNLSSGDLDIMGAWKRAALNKYKNGMGYRNPWDIETLNNCVLKAEYHSVNVHWIDEHYDDPKVVAFINELHNAMLGDDYFNEDDSMTDYFYRSHYCDINVGNSKPYVFNGEAAEFDLVPVPEAA